MSKNAKSWLADSSQKRVAIYLRVSTMEQSRESGGFWIDTQERMLRSYIDANIDNGWITSDDLIYIDEGFSGASEVSERPALSRLKVDVIAWKIDVLLCWKIDRLFRKTTFLLDFIEFIRKRGVNFVSKNENIDLSSHTGKLVLTLIWAIAEMEREVIAERTHEGKISKAMQGYMVYGKYVPYGYMKLWDGKGYRLALHPEDSKIVKEIFDMYAYDGKSSGEIARILTNRNIGTNIDRMIEEGSETKTKRHGWLFRQSSVVRILKNETYTWNYVCNKTKLSKNEDWKLIQLPKDESEWIRIPCDSIVDINTFKKAQEVLSQGQTLHGHGKIHYFTWLIRCTECGHVFSYYMSHKKTGQYRCAGKKKDKIALSNLCTNRDISEMKLMEKVWPHIELFLRNPGELISKYEATLQNGVEKEREDNSRRELAEIESSIAKKRQELKEALRKELSNQDNATLYHEIMNDIGLEVQALEKHREKLSKDISAFDRHDESVRVVMEQSKALSGKIETLNDEDKAILIRQLVHKIYISKTKINIKYRFEKYPE